MNGMSFPIAQTQPVRAPTVYVSIVSGQIAGIASLAGIVLLIVKKVASSCDR